ncbi:MAG: DUF3489 domain-containing protein [Nitratireductor sp.]|nr:DUF3489 domain-containing protein [Nitratireductor sp.]
MKDGAGNESGDAGGTVKNKTIEDPSGSPGAAKKTEASVADLPGQAAGKTARATKSGRASAEAKEPRVPAKATEPAKSAKAKNGAKPAGSATDNAVNRDAKDRSDVAAETSTLEVAKSRSPRSGEAGKDGGEAGTKSQKGSKPGNAGSADAKGQATPQKAAGPIGVPSGKRPAKSTTRHTDHPTGQSKGASTNKAVDPSKGRGREASAKVTKGRKVISLLSRKNGASIAEMMEATGWQAHSVRGFLSGTIRKKFGDALVSMTTAKGERRYVIRQDQQ